ncbi:MAG TPA: hypothetical protein VNX21_09615, partial [Candidatus Thermoplasmatota archaeon]|nr:hypothetical protein [Candidatus Thermoplasmatota archaeon]
MRAPLMAAYNPDEDVFETVCKMGTGLNDEQLAQAKTMLEPLRRCACCLNMATSSSRAVACSGPLSSR